jgi:hypothetical protein
VFAVPHSLASDTASRSKRDAVFGQQRAFARHLLEPMRALGQDLFVLHRRGEECPRIARPQTDRPAEFTRWKQARPPASHSRS